MLRLTVAAVIFLSISRAHQHFSVLGLFRPALVLVLIAAAWAFLQPKKLSPLPLLATWPARYVAAFGAMACVSTIFGISIGGSGAYILSDYSKTLLLFFLAIATIRDLRDLVAYIWAFLLGAAFQVYLTLFVFQVHSAFGSATMRLGDLYMFDANDIGCILLVALPLAALMMQVVSGWRRLLCLLLLLGIGASIARSGSRGAFVGLVAVGAALLFWLKGVSVAKRIGFVSAVTIGIAAFSPPGYWEQMRTILSPKQDYNWQKEDGRRQVWIRGMGYLMQYPIAGLGPNNFARAECTIGPKADAHKIGTGILCLPPHNTYVQAAAELGVPGFVIWCLLILRGVFVTRRLDRRVPRQWEFADPESRFLFLAPTYFSIAVIGFAVSTFFVTFAYVDLVYLLMAMIAGLTVSLAGRGVPTELAARTRASPPRGRSAPRGGGVAGRSAPAHA